MKRQGQKEKKLDEFRKRKDDRERSEQGDLLTQERALEKLENDSSVTFSDHTDSTNYGRSSVIFSKLQDEVRKEALGIKESIIGKPKKKKTNSINKYKL